jgi:hypothetical protein
MRTSSHGNLVHSRLSFKLRLEMSGELNSGLPVSAAKLLSAALPCCVCLGRRRALPGVSRLCRSTYCVQQLEVPKATREHPLLLPPLTPALTTAPHRALSVSHPTLTYKYQRLQIVYTA